MKIVGSTPLGVLGVMLLLLFTAGCKDPLIEDNSLIDNGEGDLNLIHLDTLSVFTTTVKSTPEVTKLSTASVGVLGSENNAVFGKTWASIYTEFNYNTTLPDIATGAILDSCIISLPYYTKNAECNTPTDVIVYQLNQRMNTSESYTADDALSVKSTPIGTVSNFIPHLSDSVKEFGISRAPQLRIKLAGSFGQNILSNAATFETVESFKNAVNGFYITTNTSRFLNGFAYFYMNQAKMILYYHTATEDSLKIEFTNNSDCARFNHYDHSFTGSAVANAINNTSSTDFFSINGAGVKTYVSIPGLDSIASNTIAVAKAELIIYGALKNSITDSIPNPNFIRLSVEGSDGKDYTINENHLYNYQRFGIPTTKNVIIGGQTYIQYSFNITNLIQNIIDKRITDSYKYLVIKTPSYVNIDDGTVNYVSPERFEGINDRNNPDLKAKIKIGFLQLNK